MTLSDL